jgi:N-acetyl-beta-hexosaminidase
MNEIVKKHDKKTLVWEGFKGKGSKNVPIPDDITVFAWESLYQRPDSLLANGYTIINSSWKPLYIVPHRSWEPEYIYNWNIARFENWWEITPAYTPIQVDDSDQIIGAQMCAWENKPQYDLPAVMWRLPAMSDRIWQPSMMNNEYDSYLYRYNIQDSKLKKVLHPFSVKVEGLESPGFMGVDQRKPYQFKSDIWIKILPYRDDLIIRYTTDGTKPGIKDSLYTQEIKLSENTDLKIQAFNQKNQTVGYIKWYPFEKSE